MLAKPLLRQLLIYVALFAAAHATLGQSQPRRLSDAQWRADLDSAVALIERYHPEPYAQVGKANFRQAQRELSEAMPRLDDRRIAARMMKLVASVRDGHTVLLANDPNGFNLWLPLSFYHFTDGLYIVAADQEYTGLIGARVDAIGDTPAAVAFERTADLLSSDNDTGRLWNCFYLSSVDALRATDVLTGSDDPTIHATLASGEKAAIAVQPLTLPFSLEHRFWGEMYPPGSRDRAGQVRLPFTSGSLQDWRAMTPEARDAMPLHLRSRMAYWYAELPEQKAIYLHMTHATDAARGEFASFQAFYEHVFDRFERGDFESFILDLRYNSGGDGSILIPFVHQFIRSDKLQRPGHLYTLTGRKTYSAGMMLVDLMLKHTNTILVGEPSGAPRNSFGDAGSHMLPNSGMQLDVSTVRWQLVSSLDKSREHPIDIPAPFSSADYFGGRDPGIDLILSQQGPWQDLPTLYRDAGAEAAKQEFARRKERWQQYPWWRAFAESEMRYVARDAAKEDRRADAKIGFEILLDRYPESWRAWRDYGDALRSWGESAQALECFRRGLELNPGYGEFREWIAELGAGGS